MSRLAKGTELIKHCVVMNKMNPQVPSVCRLYYCLSGSNAIRRRLRPCVHTLYLHCLLMDEAAGGREGCVTLNSCFYVGL